MARNFASMARPLADFNEQCGSGYEERIRRAHRVLHNATAWHYESKARNAPNAQLLDTYCNRMVTHFIASGVSRDYAYNRAATIRERWPQDADKK